MKIANIENRVKIQRFWNNCLRATLICSGISASTLSASSLSDIGRFDGSTGIISTCVGLYSSDGDLLTNPQGQPERFRIELALASENEAGDEFTFGLKSAVPATQTSCSGRYQNGTFTDSITIENAGANFAGKLYSLTMRPGSGDQISFVLEVNQDNFKETRNLNSNSIAFGSDLGDFQSASQRTFNTVNLPTVYPLQAPQCSDADGDTAEVLVEIAGQVVQREKPGREFFLNTKNMTTGTTEIRARCSDISALTSQAGGESFGTSTAHASGVVSMTIAVDNSCTTSIDSYMQNLTETFPTWEQLQCFTSALPRQSRPAFHLLGSDTPPDESSWEPPLFFFDLAKRDVEFDATWPLSTVSSANLSEAPPHLINGASTYTDQEWDQKLRAMATYGIYRKLLGSRIEFNFFYPPSTGEPGTDRTPVTQNSAEFLSWWQDVYIPERVGLAQVAERINAEYYQPWDVEPGQFVRAMGDVWLENLTAEEQVNVTQQAIDMLYAAVRPEFSGTLVIINFDRYAAHGNHWQQLDLSAWDQVHFAIFTEGDVSSTERYLQEQLGGYTTMIERDGIENWGIAETTVDPARHQNSLDQNGEGVQFADIELDIYQAIFTAMANLENSPKAFSLTVGNLVTPEAEALVRKNFAILAEDN